MNMGPELVILIVWAVIYLGLVIKFPMGVVK